MLIVLAVLAVLMPIIQLNQLVAFGRAGPLSVVGRCARRQESLMSVSALLTVLKLRTKPLARYPMP